MPRIISKNWFRLTLIFVASFGVSLALASLVRIFIFSKKTNAEYSATPVTETESQPSAQAGRDDLPDFIDLQPVVDNWIETLPATTEIGLSIFDLGHERTAAEYDPDATFSNASLYKLFFTYDGYSQVDLGHASLSDEIETPESTYRLEDCLDRMIRISDNVCAETLYDDPGRQQRINDLIQNSALGRTTEAGLYSTPADMVKFLRIIWQHPNLSLDSWARLQDSMLDQPLTESGDDPRQGTPSGFTTARVYAKSGYASDQTTGNWLVYNDALLIDFATENRQYALVVMTENLPDVTLLRDLGAALETYILTGGVE